MSSLAGTTTEQRRGDVCRCRDESGSSADSVIWLARAGSLCVIVYAMQLRISRESGQSFHLMSDSHFTRSRTPVSLEVGQSFHSMSDTCCTA